jgi:hypothetical protein
MRSLMLIYYAVKPSRVTTLYTVLQRRSPVPTAFLSEPTELVLNCKPRALFSNLQGPPLRAPPVLYYKLLKYRLH